MGFGEFGEKSDDNKKFLTAQKLYDEGWALEIKKYFVKSNSKVPPIPLCDSANSKFTCALTQFKNILKENNENKEISKYIEMTSLKLSGNEKLKRALTCRRQTTAAFQEGNHRHGFIRWKDSFDDFVAAKKYFMEGHDLAGNLNDKDKRFLDSIKFVENQLTELVEERRKVDEDWEDIKVKFEIERELEKQCHGEILKQLEGERETEGLLKEDVLKIHEILTPFQPILPLFFLRIIDNIEY